ncbi:MAG: Gfo/Idh/MocA family oxidoreductase [Bdellovibrionales bacterium]|nr:Gfo/Idh/MocA family oxidoreductase [Bdellovibrionales bacterium]
MKIAILGASAISAKLLPTLKTLPMFEWAGIASTNDTRGFAFSSEHKIPYLGNYQAVYDNKEIEAVYITTSNLEHESSIENALRSGKHVLCEKPLVLSAAAARKLFDVSKQTKRLLLEGLMYRFHPQIQEMVKRVHSDEYGQPKRINATFSFDYGNGPHLERRLGSGGGALSDLGCYLIDFINLISKCSPVKNIQKIEKQIPTSFGVCLQLENGIIAEIRSSMDAPSINTWEVICERGSLSVNRYNPHERIETTLQIVNDESELTIVQFPNQGSGLDQFLSEFINFHDSVMDKATPFISANESISNAVMMDLIQATKTTQL